MSPARHMRTPTKWETCSAKKKKWMCVSNFYGSTNRISDFWGPCLGAQNGEDVDARTLHFGRKPVASDGGTQQEKILAQKKHAHEGCDCCPSEQNIERREGTACQDLVLASLTSINHHIFFMIFV